MSTNPLDPTTPIGSSATAELAEMLRNIKSRLVTDKDNIASLQSVLAAYGSITPRGKAIIETTDTPGLHDVLGYSATIKSLLGSADIPAALAALGLTNLQPTITTSGLDFSVLFSGGFCVNILYIHRLGDAAYDGNNQTDRQMTKTLVTPLSTVFGCWAQDATAVETEAPIYENSGSPYNNAYDQFDVIKATVITGGTKVRLKTNGRASRRGAYVLALGIHTP